MKKLITLLLLSWPTWATTTVTGTVQNLGTGNVTSGAFVRFWLRGCGGNQPRINGTSIIGPSQGGVFYFDFPVNGSGQISGTLYSTRDATGNNGGDIECGGSTTAVWYGMQAFSASKGGPEVPVAAKNTVTLDISNVTPITTNPVIAAPTGDTTYCRLDAGNCGFTAAPSVPALLPSLGANTGTIGSLLFPFQVGTFDRVTVVGPGNSSFANPATFSGGLTATSVNGINFADQFASEQAAVTAQVKGAVLNANGTYTTDPTNTALNKILLDFNDSRFLNVGTDHAGLRFYCNVSAANTFTQSAAPYECLAIESHAAALNSGGALHYASFMVMPNADAALADGNAVYGIYVNGQTAQTTATSITQHAAIEAVFQANGGASNASGIWGGDFHVIKPSGTADGNMIGVEIGMHKAPTLGAAENWGLLIHSDSVGAITATTAGDAIRIGGAIGWTNYIDAVSTAGASRFLVDATGKVTATSAGTSFVCNNQSAGQGCKTQYNDNAVNEFATGLDGSDDYVILDQTSSRNRFLANQGTNASTNINANGSGQVVLNNLGTGGVLLPSVAFASLPASPNGTVFYCSDCKNVVDNAATAGAACAGSGSGAFAKRENGRWDCN